MLPKILRDVKETVYKGSVRPVLDYGSSIWDPKKKKNNWKACNAHSQICNRKLEFSIDKVAAYFALKWNYASARTRIHKTSFIETFEKW